MIPISPEISALYGNGGHAKSGRATLASVMRGN
jgi:hypothetical protein